MTKTGFEAHGIKHLSATQINMFETCTARWLLSYVFSKRFPPNANMARGTAAEAGIEYGLINPDATLEECVTKAEQSYDRAMSFVQDPDKNKERDKLADYVAVGLPYLREYGPIELPEQGRQHKVELWLPDVSVPIIGYKDFCFTDKGLIVDLKTSSRAPAGEKLSRAHKKQGAIYQHASQNWGMQFVYVTPKKVVKIDLEYDDYARAINEVHRIAQAMERFLSLSDDPDELARIVAPNYDSFYWSGAQERVAGREIFGY